MIFIVILLFWMRFISYYPLKQGLKPEGFALPLLSSKIYILLSIKTRIETPTKRCHAFANKYLYPTIH